MSKARLKFWEPYIKLIGAENFNTDGENISANHYCGHDLVNLVGGDVAANAMLQYTIEKHKKYNEIINQSILTTQDLRKLFLNYIEKAFYDKELVHILSNFEIDQSIEEHWNLIISCWEEQEFNTSSESRKNNWRTIFALKDTIPTLKDEVPDSFTAYRAGNPDGFSWTLDKEQAIWFQNRFKREFGNIPFLVKNFTKEDVLFYVAREEEVVIVPKY